MKDEDAKGNLDCTGIRKTINIYIRRLNGNNVQMRYKHQKSNGVGLFGSTGGDIRWKSSNHAIYGSYSSS